jgi:very-short-patch-repair endonuclease
MKNKIKTMEEEHKRKIGLANSIRMKEYWKDKRPTQKQIETLEVLKNSTRNKKQIFGYVNSPETREKLSKIMKEKWKNGDVSEKQKHQTEETKQKKIKSREGYRHSEETKKKIGEANKIKLFGKKQSKETIEKRRNKLMGHFVSEETKQKMRDNAKINPNFGMKGKHLSKEHIDKIVNSNLGKHHSEESKNRISEKNKGHPVSEETRIKIKEARAKQVIPKQDTLIELKIQKFLTLLNIEYFAHKYISNIEHKYCCDIFIPSLNLIIECDGDYFHSNPKLYKEGSLNDRQIEQKERDILRNIELEEKGYRVLRIWEHDIKVMELNDFKELIN